MNKSPFEKSNGKQKGHHYVDARLIMKRLWWTWVVKGLRLKFHFERNKCIDQDTFYVCFTEKRWGRPSLCSQEELWNAQPQSPENQAVLAYLPCLVFVPFLSFCSDVHYMELSLDIDNYFCQGSYVFWCIRLFFCVCNYSKTKECIFMISFMWI